MSDIMTTVTAPHNEPNGDSAQGEAAQGGGGVQRLESRRTRQLLCETAEVQTLLRRIIRGGSIVLQQQWLVKRMKLDGTVVEAGVEWRDVPLVGEEV